MNLEGLEIRLAFLREQMDNIRSSGELAPAGTWIQKYEVPKKNGKKYYYYRLMEATNKKSKTGSIQGKVKLYLGNAKNKLYKRFKLAISRRNQLKLLQRRYDKLMALYKAALSKVVSSGFEQEITTVKQGVTAVAPSTIALVDLLPQLEEISKLQQNQAHMWYGLRVIAEKLGITIPEPIASGG